MKPITVYQTIEDKSNPREIISEGPFPCNDANAWFGYGYYFWETFIDNAHWWGKDVRKFEKGHVVCEARYDFDEEKCLDLVDNHTHMTRISSVIEVMKKKGFIKGNTTFIRVANFLKKIGTFHYEAVRANPSKSRRSSSSFSSPLLVQDNNYEQFIDLCPTIQICFFEKYSLNLRDYKIVFPEKYSDTVS